VRRQLAFIWLERVDDAVSAALEPAPAHKFTRVNHFSGLSALPRNFAAPNHLVLRRREAASKDGDTLLNP